MEVKIEQSITGATVIVPGGFQTTTCIRLPEINPDQHWNAVVGENARAVFCEREIRSSEITVEAGAQLDLVSLQVKGHSPTHEVTKRIILKDNAVVRIFTGLFQSANVTLVGKLEGTHSAYENHVIYFASGQQKMRLELNAEHIGTNTMSRTLVRGVAVDKSHADFAGSINIHQTGSQTDGHLEHEGLLMSRQARIDALPGLQIDTDDVKASHSSAVHFIRPEQLFYLQSRGISKGDARKMIVAGFLEEMLATVQEPQLLKEIHSIVRTKQKLLPHE